MQESMAAQEFSKTFDAVKDSDSILLIDQDKVIASHLTQHMQNPYISKLTLYPLQNFSRPANTT